MTRTMLVKVNAGDNNNKFYEVTLENGLITKRYGRVGATGTTITEHGGQWEYDRAVASKVKRGYKPVDLIDAPINRPQAGQDLIGVAQKKIPVDQSDKDLAKLVAEWCQANRHNIETSSGGLITVSTTGVVSTALGVVSQATLKEARNILNQITKKKDKTPVEMIEEYLTLIPQKVGHSRGWEHGFVQQAELSRQMDFLDSLDGSLALAATMQPDGDEVDAQFRFNLHRLDPSEKAFTEIVTRFNKSRNTRHTSSALKLSNAWTMGADVNEQTVWRALADTHGNVRRLWHGTQQFNLISILHRGLFCPPSNGSFVTTGRMFGDGVYFSDQSTKSLNYSHGYWGNGPRSNRCYMFVTDVVMGKEHRPIRSGDAVSAAKKQGCHSVNAQGGKAGVLNNEMVIWNVDQIKMSYLCEFS